MTKPPYDNTSVTKVLKVYSDAPLDEGDAVLLFLDGKVCLEIEGLATEWDEELCSSTAGILRRTGRQAVVAIARPNAALLPSDYQLWRDLHAELRDSEVELLPVRALPAA